MNWQNLVIEIVLAIVSAIGAWVLTKVRKLINAKIENEDTRKLADTAISIVYSCVKATYQTYVEKIKGTDLWTTEAQEKALQLAINAAKPQITSEVQKYIERSGLTVDDWLHQQIEAAIYSLKNNKDKVAVGDANI